MRQFRHLGLQKRIMLYVAVMFGVVAVLGLDAIDEAARLVYRERKILRRKLKEEHAASAGVGT